MANGLFVAAMSLAFTALLTWGFRKLPGEGMQFLAAVPSGRSRVDRSGDAGDHSPLWHGTNFTYYGVFLATSQVAALLVMIVLLGSSGIPARTVLATLGLLLFVCVAASKAVARIVEGKKNTFTVGGASFVGIIAAPLILLLAGTYLTGPGERPVPLMPFLGAAAISYALGEAIGRLGCISFGCCYGRPLSGSNRSISRLFGRFCLVFAGKTKKISYEARLDGHAVLPVQALTSLIFALAGLTSMSLFLSGYPGTAFVAATTVTQIWRVVSEFLRADHRGKGRITAYQLMALASVPYAVLLYIMVPEPMAAPEADILQGLRVLWDPAVILFLQGAWIASFMYFGRSRVTGSTLSFHVHADRI